MNTPYGIFEYDLNHFCAYIAYQTNTNFSYTRQKKQIIYLDNYLTQLSQGFNLCFVYENEYIDKNYIDDFSTYYLNCFRQYKKTTSRIHFFKYLGTKNLKDEFSLALDNQDSVFKNDHYLGFMVIRPIPKTFLARVCLKPFHLKENNRLKKYYLTKKYDISLFGILLSVESIAFQEQDKVLSACATTSLWSFYHAHKNSCQTNIPSSSQITKSAYPEQNGYTREFPNNGLSTEMISRSLRKEKLSPEYFEFTTEKKERLQEILFAYCSSGIPIILGVSVNGKDGISKGLHAITVLGYSIESINSSSNLISHSLKKIYAHDDRYGPFIRMELRKDEFYVQLDENTKTNIIEDEIYKVDTLILGLYHKIRIPYIPIKNSCLVLAKNLKDFVSSFNQIDKNELSRFCNLIDKVKWDISITENGNLKKQLIKDKYLTNKEKHLTKALPKYLWCAKATLEGNTLFGLLFDATDIEQGNVFIDYLSYNNNISELISTILKKYAKEKMEIIINNIDIFEEKDEDNYLNGILNYFNKEESYQDSLDDMFGYLKIPLLIKNEEINNNVINNTKVFRSNYDTNFKLNYKLEPNSKYIWIIDKDGFLVIGIEKSKNGHPTLTNGMPARIGGELILKEENTTYFWEINSKSGRYSKEYEKDKQNLYLINALRYRFNTIFPNEQFTLKDIS